MPRPYLIISDIEALAGSGAYSGLAALNNYSVAILLSALTFVRLHSNWQGAGYTLTDAEIDKVDAWIAQIEVELMTSTIGMIIPFANSVTPTGMLLCDGTQYLRTDYPALYDVLDTAFIDDADHFTVPDLTDRFIYGDGTFNPGDTGGSSTVALSTNELPPHAHSYLAPNTTLSVGGAGAPTPANIGTVPSVTGSQGSGAAHENMPPYLVLKYGIISGQP